MCINNSALAMEIPVKNLKFPEIENNDDDLLVTGNFDGDKTTKTFVVELFKSGTTEAINQFTFGVERVDKPTRSYKLVGSFTGSNSVIVTTINSGYNVFFQYKFEDVSPAGMTYDVKVRTVPEPTTLPLLVSGLCFILFRSGVRYNANAINI